jgi:hypothetical protein
MICLVYVHYNYSLYSGRHFTNTIHILLVLEWRYKSIPIELMGEILLFVLISIDHCIVCSSNYCFWLSSLNGWVIVVLRPFNNFSAISWQEQVNYQWDDDDVHFVLDQDAELDFYSASSLKQPSVNRNVAPLGHMFLIPSNQSLFFLLNATCLVEKQQIPI